MIILDSPRSRHHEDIALRIALSLASTGKKSSSYPVGDARQDKKKSTKSLPPKVMKRSPQRRY